MRRCDEHRSHERPAREASSPRRPSTGSPPRRRPAGPPRRTADGRGCHGEPRPRPDELPGEGPVVRSLQLRQTFSPSSTAFSATSCGCHSGGSRSRTVADCLSTVPPVAGIAAHVLTLPATPVEVVGMLEHVTVVTPWPSFRLGPAALTRLTVQMRFLLEAAFPEAELLLQDDGRTLWADVRRLPADSPLPRRSCTAAPSAPAGKQYCRRRTVSLCRSLTADAASRAGPFLTCGACPLTATGSPMQAPRRRGSLSTASGSHGSAPADESRSQVARTC
ncbi:hypothetical protein SAMN06272737_10639 [Blastococcus mobilis]|uniref:Uncharacterized protein n=1 Tax=Blastococcus mobilis TaxID=1938746 RepID=A0A238W293_9ACTN|nr:hypothetical protein SAMN06272737_10639 [Blastococcus mobilis]